MNGVTSGMDGDRVRFRRSFIEEVQARLIQMGFTKCPICQSEVIGAHRHPLMGHHGGLPSDDDPDVNVLFFVRVECQSCGYTMLFNSEKFRDGDTKIIIRGLTQEEEDELDSKDPLR